jgi:hypothetical protein
MGVIAAASCWTRIDVLVMEEAGQVALQMALKVRKGKVDKKAKT